MSDEEGEAVLLEMDMATAGRAAPPAAASPAAAAAEEGVPSAFEAPVLTEGEPRDAGAAHGEGASASSGGETADAAPAEAIRAALRKVLHGEDFGAISIGECRRRVAQELGFEPGALDCRKDEFKSLVAALVRELPATLPRGEVSPLDVLIAEVEKGDAVQEVYLVTVARVLGARLPDGREYLDLGTVDRKGIADAVANAFNRPMQCGPSGGRPRSEPNGKPLVAMVVVFREHHEDGSIHFHAAVKLTRSSRFQSAKRTLREVHLLPSHFSCSHSKFWSAVRYGYMETPAKPEVDDAPWIWTPTWSGFAADTSSVDLFQLSQEPYVATAWRKRREAVDKTAGAKQAKTSFEKMDLTSVIISKHLWSKDGLLAYAQDHGTKAMQRFVHNRQGKLSRDIDDAKEWDAARANAAFEAVDDWTLLNRCAEGPCPHGARCSYSAAVAQIFESNAATLSVQHLAGSLRDIILAGPKKTTRVPFLVGPSNSGKSTVIYPFDDLFSPKRILHKPALGSTFGLRNLVGGTKRFILWDDFRPVEFAHEKTVPVSLFLSLFVGQHTEIQVSQSFNDGNKDVSWNRGVVFTGKQEGLWETTKRVSAEDVRHMRNRVQEFVFSAVLPDHSLQDVTSCARCMSAWIVRGAAEFDAAAVLRSAPCQAPPRVQSSRVERAPAPPGFAELVAAVQLPSSVAESLLRDLEALGAVTVGELRLADWEGLDVWPSLRLLQKRRLLDYLHALHGS